jgi:hypothetical protein
MRIGLIDPLPGTELISAATVAVFEALDTWALNHPGESADSVAGTLSLLLARLWHAKP